MISLRKMCQLILTISERIAELTNSTLVIDLIPNELEQVELQIEEEKQ